MDDEYYAYVYGILSVNLRILGGGRGVHGWMCVSLDYCRCVFLLCLNVVYVWSSFVDLLGSTLVIVYYPLHTYYVVVFFMFG